MTCLDQHISELKQLSAEAYQALQPLLTLRQGEAGDILQPIGHTCRTIYLMCSGAARIFYYREEKDITEHFAFEGDFVVRVESLYTGHPSTKGIELLKSSRVLAIDSVGLFRLYDLYPQVERVFRKRLEMEHVKTIRRLESMQMHSPEMRYKQLLDEVDWINTIPLKHLASYLGITPVSLSRIRARIQPTH